MHTPRQLTPQVVGVDGSPRAARVVAGAGLAFLTGGRHPAPKRAAAVVVRVLLIGLIGLVSALLVHGDYPALVWTAYIAAGLAIGRLDLTSARVATRPLGCGAVLAVGVWCVSSAALSLLSRAPRSTTPFDMLHTLGAATAPLAALLLLTRIAAARRVLSPLATAGSRPADPLLRTPVPCCSRSSGGVRGDGAAGGRVVTAVVRRVRRTSQQAGAAAPETAVRAADHSETTTRTHRSTRSMHSP